MRHKHNPQAKPRVPRGRRRSRANHSSRQILLNPPPPDVCAQCAKDNERRMRLHAAALFARRNHCD